MLKKFRLLLEKQPEFAAVVLGVVVYLFLLLMAFVSQHTAGDSVVARILSVVMFPFALVMLFLITPGFFLASFFQKIDASLFFSAFFWALLVYLFVGLPIRMKMWQNKA